MVGEVGVQAILARSVKYVNDLDGLAEELWGRLRQEDSAVVTEIGVALIASVFDLVSTFIGDELTLRLFGGVWPDAISALDAEKT